MNIRNDRLSAWMQLRIYTRQIPANSSPKLIIHNRSTTVRVELCFWLYHSLLVIN